MTAVPAIRVHAVNRQPVAGGGDHVLYWMIAQRRLGWNFALQRAVEWSAKLGKPLLILEPLRCGYQLASERLHRFVLDGMADNARGCAERGIAYHPYVEPIPEEGKGLLAALAKGACMVVTDEFPCFFLPRMVAAAAASLPVLLETVDGNGLLPLRAATVTYPTAYAFRRMLQGKLPLFLRQFPAADPLAAAPKLASAVIAPAIRKRWPAAAPALLAGDQRLLSSLLIDHHVAPVAIRGGAVAGQARLRWFLGEALGRYLEERSEPDQEVASGLSPYLHFGHLSAHQAVAGVLAGDGWSPDRLGGKVDGKREGWWGASAAAESFLDELVTWRELGYNFAFNRADYDRYESLPPWALKTLDEHAGDARPDSYDFADFAAARTRDPLWNAAQCQLLREGRMHNYLRMLWGKKILEWSPSPRQALATMIELNNRYALDGRDPNSYSGIFWTLGRFDRPWAPVRPIFGCIRYMSSLNTAKKFSVKGYLARYRTDGQQQLDSL